MKRFIFAAIAVHMLAMLVSCGQVDTSHSPSIIQVSVEATKNEDDSFTISTNLPDDTSLTLSLSSVGFSRVQVSDGKAISKVFSDKGARLNGEYTLYVTMLSANLQSDAVKAVIGDNGEYLAGELVKESSNGSKVVDAEFIFTITAPAGSAPAGSVPATPPVGNDGPKKSALDIIKETAYGSLTRTQKLTIINWIEDRYDYYDKMEGRYAGDKYTTTIFNEAAKKYNKTYQEIDDIWWQSYELKYK